jgi:hypothetical protein
MARDNDQLSGFESENTGGLLSGLLADEDVFDRRSLLRLGSWGAASVGAVIIALYANQSSIGQRREQLAAADLARQAQQIQSVAKQSQGEASRLASAIETLNDDRDRLYSRVTTLEQGLDSVTGAITRQVAAPPAAPAASAAVSPPAAAATPATAAAAPPVPVTATPAMAAATEPPAVAKSPPPAAPVVAPVATTVAAAVVKSTDKPPVDTTAPVAAPVTVSSIAKSNNANAQASAPMPPPLMAAKSMMAPPDAAASKLIEPEKPSKAAMEAKPEQVAAAPPADNAEPEASDAPKLAVQRTEFGVDVGGANSVGGLRALWRGLLKSRSNAALTTLHPIMVIRERSNGLGMQLRLVAGPLGDAATAAKICAGLIESDRPCETTVFDGQRLSMNADEPAAAEAPAPDKAPVVKPAAVRSSSHRHSSAKRAENIEPAKKPDSPSGFSAFFSRR